MFEPFMGEEKPAETPVAEAKPAEEATAVTATLRVLILGASGMLGTDMADEARRRGWDVKTPPHEELDISKPDHLEKLRVQDWGNLDWVINCAAYTAVDKAETEFWLAQALNGTAPGILAMICKRNKQGFVHISTDFVFDGDAAEPYNEDHETRPQSKYGQSKRFGELNVQKENADAIIVRTSWLFGPNGKSFPRTLINRWREGKSLHVVADQTGTPTYTADLARTIADMVERRVSGGIYHAAGPDVMTWRDLAEKAIFAWRAHFGPAEQAVDVHGIATTDWPTPAKRPPYSALSTAKVQALGIPPMRPMGDALGEFVSRLGPDAPTA
jgi:dTDP-4-dehydrorhamnose reductase